MLQRSASSFGLVALSGVLADAGFAQDLAPRRSHFPGKAKQVILLFMDGGVSHVDTFDPKPRLQQEHGRPFRMPVEATQFDAVGNTLASPFRFQRHGQSGLPISDLFPHLSRRADELCIIRSMRAPLAEHAQACYLMHLGAPLRGRPSLGSWVSYGLGSEAADLPGYVVLDGGLVALGGIANYASGFLPATHEGSLFRTAANAPVVPNIQAADPRGRGRLARFVAEGDRTFAQRLGPEGNAVESAIANFELAGRMQGSVPAVADFSAESRATRQLYGVDAANPLTARYARQCLLARRLIERGVRFVELTCVAGIRNVAPWDSHGNIREDHRKNADAVDQPVAALLYDLRARGLLESTLVVWATEFGRTPFAQGSGRDHNPQGFSIWLAGAGVRAGMAYGATDEYGYHAVEGVVGVHDLHATILHLLGFDHTRLTFRYAGRDFRLTDVHGEVIHKLLV
jgi:hypothetical protein